jgi:UDP-glucose:(heptosyl)LPS alpha-1,3-glucosyltransferase
MIVHTIPIQAPTRTTQTTQFMRRAADELHEDRFDVIHSMLPIPGSDIYQPRGGTVAESAERNLAMIRSGVLRKVKRIGNRLNKKQQVQLTQEADLLKHHPETLVAAVSDYVVKQLRRHYQLDDARIRMVFNGVDAPDASDDERLQDRRGLQHQFGLGQDELILLMVAHNFRLKGVARGIEAVARLDPHRGPTVRALVVGRGHPARFRRLADRLGVADRIIFVGPTERVSAFYHAADILIHPTYYDPCSRVVLEALVTGLPAITTRHNGAAEVIEDGVHGYVVESADAVDQLADRVRQLADDATRQRCAQNGRRLRQPLSMRRHVSEMLSVYDEILYRRKHR